MVDLREHPESMGVCPDPDPQVRNLGVIFFLTPFKTFSTTVTNHGPVTNEANYTVLHSAQQIPVKRELEILQRVITHIHTNQHQPSSTREKERRERERHESDVASQSKLLNPIHKSEPACL